MAKKTEHKEEEVTVTLRELAVFRDAAARYQIKYKDERSPLTWGLKKQSQKYEKIQQKHAKDLAEKINELNMRHASLKDGNLVENRFDFKSGFADKDQTEIRYSYTPEKRIELDKAIRKANEEFEAKEVKITPFIVEIAPNFDFSFYDAFKKFMFKELSEEEEYELYLKSGEKDKKDGQKPSIVSVLN